MHTTHSHRRESSMSNNNINSVPCTALYGCLRVVDCMGQTLLHHWQESYQCHTNSDRKKPVSRHTHNVPDQPQVQGKQVQFMPMGICSYFYQTVVPLSVSPGHNACQLLSCRSLLIGPTRTTKDSFLQNIEDSSMDPLQSPKGSSMFVLDAPPAR